MGFLFLIFATKYAQPFFVQNPTFFVFAFYLIFSHVCPNSSRQLHQENECQQNRERHCHAVILFYGSAASEEGHEEDDAAHHDQEDGCVEEAVVEEVQILGIHSLDGPSG